MEDDRVSNKKLLVTESNKRHRERYRGMWHMPENEG